MVPWGLDSIAHRWLGQQSIRWQRRPSNSGWQPNASHFRTHLGWMSHKPDLHVGYKCLIVKADNIDAMGEILSPAKEWKDECGKSMKILPRPRNASIAQLNLPQTCLKQLVVTWDPYLCIGPMQTNLMWFWYANRTGPFQALPQLHSSRSRRDAAQVDGSGELRVILPKSFFPSDDPFGRSRRRDLHLHVAHGFPKRRSAQISIYPCSYHNLLLGLLARAPPHRSVGVGRS
jgi:hypothetical protein